MKRLDFIKNTILGGLVVYNLDLETSKGFGPDLRDIANYLAIRLSDDLGDEVQLENVSLEDFESILDELEITMELESSSPSHKAYSLEARARGEDTMDVKLDSIDEVENLDI